MCRVKQWNRGSVVHRFAGSIFTCVCVQFAVVGLLGGIEMFLDEEGARHGGGGPVRADNGPGGGPTASQRLRCGGGQAGASEVTRLSARLSSSGLGGDFSLAFTRNIQSQSRGSDFSSSFWDSCEQRKNLLSD